MPTKTARALFWFFCIAIPLVYFAIAAFWGWSGIPHMRHHLAHQGIFWTHVLGASGALLLMPFQFWKGLRVRRRDLHIWVGRSYVALVLIGGLSGLYMAFFPMTGPIAGAGFFSLAVLWLGFTAMAYSKARARDIPAHQRWMIRSAALTFAAVTLRLYLPTTQLIGLPMESSYTAIAWACWVPNLIAVEWWHRHMAPSVAASAMVR
jgi:uncharacterized membrane protein